MNVELINQLYLKLKLEYKTKKEVYEKIKRELSLEVKTESIKKAHQRYLEKKETEQDKARQKKDKRDKTLKHDKEATIKTAIILNKENKTDEELIKETKVSTATFYKYKKELRTYLIERSQRILEEAIEYAYPDQDVVLKQIKARKRNVLIQLVKLVEEKMTNKDVQVAVGKAIENIKLIEKEIQTDLQIVSIYSQVEYEKQLVEENVLINRFELDKSKAVETETDKEIQINLKGVRANETDK